MRWVDWADIIIDMLLTTLTIAYNNAWRWEQQVHSLEHILNSLSSIVHLAISTHGL